MPISNYFQNFPLKTKKLRSFQKWSEVFNLVLEKSHLTQTGLTKIRILAKEINLNNSLNTKTGSANIKSH